MGVFSTDLGVLVRDDQWIILLLALVPGIWEELAFRGVILSHLQRCFSPWAAVTVSSVLFGLFHLNNLWASDAASAIAGVVAATILGIAWGYLVVRSNSVLPAVVLHYTVDVLLDAEAFIAPDAGDDALATVFIGITTLWPALMILIARGVFGNLRQEPSGALPGAG